MKLTNEQTTIISNYLDSFGIREIDIKLEVLDHIATEIEEIIITKKIEFEVALKSVMICWHPLFAQKRSINIGLIYSFPRIVGNKLERSIKKSYFYYVGLFAIWAIFSFVIKYDFSSLGYLNNFLNIASLIIGVNILILLLLINYKAKHTTYRFLVNQASPILLFIIFIQLFDGEMYTLKMFMTSMLFLQFLLMCENFIKHKKCTKKYQLV
ncbi:hypothetical protein ACFSX9_07715 [Flavobacterium ardleyense]|uniref:Uncharacterized protein n=1 Tax=Flavobacterium ardleyense TaxID=2038737 RepID=A0ABW5Z7I6_9FLAO